MSLTCRLSSPAIPVKNSSLEHCEGRMLLIEITAPRTLLSCTHPTYQASRDVLRPRNTRASPLLWRRKSRKMELTLERMLVSAQACQEPGVDTEVSTHNVFPTSHESRMLLDFQLTFPLCLRGSMKDRLPHRVRESTMWEISETPSANCGAVSKHRYLHGLSNAPILVEYSPSGSQRQCLTS